jgi:hypothetical protein
LVGKVVTTISYCGTINEPDIRIRVEGVLIINIDRGGILECIILKAEILKVEILKVEN